MVPTSVHPVASGIEFQSSPLAKRAWKLEDVM
jgi:hypothetical protein